MKLWLTIIFLLCTRPFLNAASYSSENITAEKGLFRLLSAEQPTAGDYHFRTSLEYFQEGDLLKDAGESKIERTRATLAFGYAFQKYFLLSLNSGFHFATREPQSASSSSGAEAIHLVRTSLSTTGFYDLSPILNLKPGRLLSAFSLWIDFSKISRFIKGPNIVPRAIFTSDFSDNLHVPFRLHLNLGFHPANDARYFDDATDVKDFDRLATETINSWGYSSDFGVEFPFRFVNPSAEFHILKVSGSDFSKSPKWVTVGVKARPFALRNIEIFGASDIGLSSFGATPTGVRPEHTATPLWNIILGFGVSRFGQREGQVAINESDLEGLRNRISETENTLSKIKSDLEYNIAQGRVYDAVTKMPLGDVDISFPESPELKAFRTDLGGQFLRYFKSLAAARMVFSKEGYEPSSKFLTLKPGERVSIDIELKREIPGQELAEFIATLSNESGEPLKATVRLTKEATTEEVSGQTDQNGQIYMKVPIGSYKLIVEADGFDPLNESLVFEKGRAILRSYTLATSSPQ